MRFYRGLFRAIGFNKMKKGINTLAMIFVCLAAISVWSQTSTPTPAKPANDKESKKAVSDAMNELLTEEMEFFKLVNKYPDAGEILSDERRLYDKGDYAGAVKALTTIINGGKAEPFHYRLRARSYLKLRQYKPALSDIDQALARNPLANLIGIADSYEIQAEIYLQMIDAKSAAVSYTKAIEATPKNAALFLARGNIYDYGIGGVRAKALMDFSKAIELDPKLAAAYCARGFLYSSHDYGSPVSQEKAVADFSRAIELLPKDARAYNGRGYSYAKLGKKAEAVADLKKVLILEPDNELAEYNLDAVLRNKEVMTAEEFERENGDPIFS